MARAGNMTVKIDLDGLNYLTQLGCMALDCQHNTVYRSHGTSCGRCGYKHLTINEGGQCGSFLKREIAAKEESS